MRTINKEELAKLLTVQVTADTAAWLLDVSPRRLRQLVAQGVIKKSDHGRYPIKVLREYYGHLQKAAQNRGYQLPDEDGLTAVRKRRLTAQAERLEIELSKLRGELMPIPEYQRELGSACMTIRERMLTLAPRVAQDLEGQARGTIEEILDREIRDVLITLATPNGNGNGHQTSDTEPRGKAGSRRGNGRRARASRSTAKTDR